MLYMKGISLHSCVSCVGPQVGKKVRVYRSDQLNWVEGTVDAFIPESGLYNVYHGDGSETEFNLATETWQVSEEEGQDIALV